MKNHLRLSSYFATKNVLLNQICNFFTIAIFVGDFFTSETSEKIPKSTFLSQNFICTEIPLELLLVQNYYSGQRIQILYFFALTRFHKHKKTYFFCPESELYLHFLHSQKSKKEIFSLFQAKNENF